MNIGEQTEKRFICYNEYGWNQFR